MEQKEAFELLAKWLDELETKYSGRKIKFLSDNPSFDIAAIDIMLETYCDRMPLRYDSKGKYRGMSDSWDMLDILGKKKDLYMKKVDELMGYTTVHDHNPANDAEVIYRMYIAAKLAEKELAKQELQTQNV